MSFWDWLTGSNKSWYWFDTWTRQGSAWRRLEDRGPEKVTDEKSTEIQHSQTLDWMFETEDLVVTGRWIWDDELQDWVLLEYV